MKAKSFRIMTFSIVGVLLAIIIALNIAASIWGDTLIRILSGKDIDDATRAAGESLAEQIVEEGTVLVKNDDNALPLDPETDKKVNVFGWSSTSWVMSGSGSGRSTNDGDASFANAGTDFLKALENAGIEYNTALTDMYKRFATRNSAAWSTLSSYDYQSCRLVEPTIAQYGDELLSNAEAFSPVAIVVLSRVAGESNDAPLVQYKGTSNTDKTPANDAASKDLTYLDASTEERELLAYVGEKFEKVIVLINSTNQMNLNFLRDIQGLDACLVTGGTGNNAITGLVNLLYGQVMYETAKNGHYGDPVSPSGRLTDTYPYDFRTNSSWANTGYLGVGKYNNAQGLYPIGVTSTNFGGEYKYPQVSYLDYVEDIYVGYKWYETADVMGFWNSNFAKNLFGIQNGYQDVVQFPFGYGLSYTDFSWEAEWQTDKQLSPLNVYDEFSVTVTVTNEGEFPAQEVVELYYTPPYTSGGIEKSAVNLLAFAKTPEPVEPGESAELTLTFTPADMGSYDSHEIRLSGGGWILEKGDYVLSLRTDAHTVANIKDNTFTMTVETKLENYDNDQAYNIFTGDKAVDYGISVDGSNTGANIKFLSRSNFEGTFPTVDKNTDRTQSTKSRDMAQTLKDHNLYRDTDVVAWENKVGASGIDMPTMGAKNDYKIFDGAHPNDLGIALGSDYDAELWDDVLDQLTYEEMRDLALHGYVHEEAIPSVGKAETASFDGPSQYGSWGAQMGFGVGYPNPSVLGQTWNQQLAKSFGLAVAGEALASGRQGWYAPGLNLHRSAFGGRNYEYFSEDSMFTGLMGTQVVEGSLNKGVYVFVKHIIGYDQETMRDSLYCWMTEQALRETYMKPFKIMIDRAEYDVEGVPGIMTSYGRIGGVWSGGSEALLTALLRDEWGYNGAILTDYADHQQFMNADQLVRAGGDMWMDGATKGNFRTEFRSTKDNAAFVSKLREGAHHVLFTICNAAYVNSGYDSEADTISKGDTAKFPLWTILGVVDGVVIAGCIAWVVLAILKKDKKFAMKETEGLNDQTDEKDVETDDSPTDENTEE